MAEKRKMPVTEIAVIAALFALMLLWGPLYQKFLAPPPPPPPIEAAGQETNTVVLPPTEISQPQSVPAAATNATAEEVAPQPQPEAEPAPSRPEQRYDLTSAVARITLSSRGASLVAAELLRYPLTKEAGSPPVTLDFAAMPSLAYEGLPGLGTNTDFDVQVAPDAGSAVLTATTRDGLRLVRTIRFAGPYDLKVEDILTNESAHARDVPLSAVTMGPMGKLQGESSYRGMLVLGIDTLPLAGGERVHHWGRAGFLSHGVTLPQLFVGEEHRGGGCGGPHLTHPLPASVRHKDETDIDWVAVKNKFFVQILQVKGGATGCELYADREVPPTEQPDNPRSWAGAANIDRVAATLLLDACTLAPRDALTRTFSYYIGPKKYTRIAALGDHREDVMEFGWFKWLCQILLWALNAIYVVLPNYGVAIILLTVLIRIVFWPITHKSTESMKRMQELQPLVNQLREKFKDKPQKLQQETMALYREHKVNPVSGCLPMLIQFPVLIALFNVLRSAVELRFAHFLWVADLSEPEGLLAGVLPIAINPLPIFMTVTQILQQKLTPTSGDPSQQKMMMFMPIIFLVFFYNMPSALVLYWTANQVMMIVQLLWHRHQQAKAKAA